MPPDRRLRPEGRELDCGITKTVHGCALQNAVGGARVDFAIALRMRRQPDGGTVVRIHESARYYPTGNPVPRLRGCTYGHGVRRVCEYFKRRVRMVGNHRRETLR